MKDALKYGLTEKLEEKTRKKCDVKVLNSNFHCVCLGNAMMLYYFENLSSYDIANIELVNNFLAFQKHVD